MFSKSEVPASRLVVSAPTQRFRLFQIGVLDVDRGFLFGGVLLLSHKTFPVSFWAHYLMRCLFRKRARASRHQFSPFENAYSVFLRKKTIVSSQDSQSAPSSSDLDSCLQFQQQSPQSLYFLSTLHNKHSAHLPLDTCPDVGNR